MTEEQKEVFWKGDASFNYVMDFKEIDTTIDCEQIHSESVQITEAICDETEMMLGGCIASSCEFDVGGATATEISGLQFSVRLEEMEGVVSLPMGVYRVDSAKKIDDTENKHVIAYDALYDASVDVDDWYNSILPDNDSSITVGALRTSLLEHLGMSYVKQSMVNDNLLIKRTIEPSHLKGTDVLKAICVVNAAFGRINREGLFEEMYPGNLGLFPEETLYPNDDVYPEDDFTYIGGEGSDAPEYYKVESEEFITFPLSCVKIQADGDAVGVMSGEDGSNPYVISGNFLLYDLGVTTLQAVAAAIYERIKGFIYRPCMVELQGLPYMEVGDSFVLERRESLVESIVFKRTLTGIQELQDTFEAAGSEIRMNETDGSTELIRINYKMLSIQKSVDGVSIGLENLEEETSTKFEQTAEHITTEVTNLRDKAYSKIEQTATGIKATVAGSQEVWDTEGYEIALAGYGELTMTAIEQSELSESFYYLDQQDGYIWIADYSYIADPNSADYGKMAWRTYRITGPLKKITAELSSRIEATEKDIKLEVSRATGAEGVLSSRLTITENGIATKVSRGDVVSEINQSPDTIELKSNRLVVESSGFKLDGNGNAAFSGTITGGTINGAEIKGGKIEGAVINGVNAITANVFYQIYGTTPVQLIKDVWTQDANGGWKNETPQKTIPSISYCNAAYGSASDYRIKKNTKPLPTNIDNVFDALRPIQYEFKDTVTAWKGKHFGELAQRIDRVMRENGLDPDEYSLTGTRELDEGMGEEPYCIDGKVHYINHEEIIWLCVDQIQKMKKEANSLRDEMNALNNEVALLRQKLSEKEENCVQ